MKKKIVIDSDEFTEVTKVERNNYKKLINNRFIECGRLYTFEKY